MKTITLDQLRTLAKQFNLPLAGVRAMVEVESAGSGYVPDGSGRPKILFERHKFHNFTNGMYSTTHPVISNKLAGGYSTGATATVRSQKEWFRMAQAIQLDSKAALASASWGMGQVMGYHWQKLGYASLQDFVNAMYESEYNQLVAMFRYCKLVPGLMAAITMADWDDVARMYNGVSYAKHQYHIKLAKAYAKFKLEA
ncbi:N-acetylmuramidase family protein [Adhaeribacter pallidiroseus]|uniref:N-acetylmuramidase domain-containing protein n=1 Tax=Adhaeribacter pallidiroseus TaxID=2072847 RepID=A0A369QEE7_9BACT|nr:N-acetylmuramidase family protein [Adhaeribacter pallidiroseus]RDC63291.1 hypothetical protein AHMF7616_01893 [Adhaeribacter pallidiroseus]